MYSRYDRFIALFFFFYNTHVIRRPRFFELLATFFYISFEKIDLTMSHTKIYEYIHMQLGHFLKVTIFFEVTKSHLFFSKSHQKLLFLVKVSKNHFLLFSIVVGNVLFDFNAVTFV